MGSLFAHLALRFGSHPENLATEALGYILQRSEPSRSAVRDLLRGFGATVDDDLTYSTQSVGDDQARPDLVARNVAGAEPLLVEVKFWAGLTDNQPVAYLKRVTDGGTLLVVAPAARLPLIWAELLRRCRDAGLDISQEQARGGGHVVSIGGDRRMIALSWRQLLSAMHAQGEARNDHVIVEDIAQLEGLCEQMDQDQFLPLSSEELTSSMYRRVVEFGALVDDVTKVLAERGLMNAKGMRPVGGNGFYGRYAVLRGVGVFVMCDVRKWMKYASTPMWLSVYGPKWSSSDALAAHRALAPLELEHPGTVFTASDKFPTVALFLPGGVERDAVLKSVIEQIEKVAALITTLGGSDITEAPAPEL